MKKFIAALLSVLLVLSLASCSGKTKPEDTDVPTTEIVDKTEVTEANEANEAIETTSASEEASEPDETQDAQQETTTAAPETTVALEDLKLPQTKAEILAAYTAVVNKVKKDMPEYTSNDWQSVSNVDMSKATYGILSTAAGAFLESKEDSVPGKHDKGTHAKWFALPTDELKEGCVLKDTSKIESATCVEKDGNYIITITLVEEKDPYMDKSNPKAVKSWHGQMFDVIDINQVTEYAKKLPGINANNAYCTYKGTAVLKYDPQTNKCITLDHIVNVNIFLGSGSAKVVADYHFYDFKW